MKITPIDIKEHRFKKGIIGYNQHDVNIFLEIVAETIEELAKSNNDLEQKLKDGRIKLAEHEEREKILREAITTAQKMAEDLKNNAKKEAELIISEAKIRGDELVKKAHEIAVKLQEEIYHLKKQRIEIQTSIKAILQYHADLLSMEVEEALKGDAMDEKLKFIKK